MVRACANGSVHVDCGYCRAYLCMRHIHFFTPNLYIVLEVMIDYAYTMELSKLIDYGMFENDTRLSN